jgi:hypothetical protein
MAATGKRVMQSAVTAAHVWNTSPATGKMTMRGQATAAHLWNVSPATGKKTMKGQATSSHVWNVVAVGIKVPLGQTTASHVWNATATGARFAVPTKQGSATAAWLARVGYLVDDDFNGPAEEFLLNFGYVAMYDSTLYYDGSGNAIASGYGGVTHPKAVLNNSWMEIAFRLADVASYVIVMLFRLPTASESNGTGTGYAVTINELGIGIDRLGVRKTSATPTMVTTKDYVMRYDVEVSGQPGTRRRIAEKMASRVAEIERTIGIADLRQFTPQG